MITSGLVYNLMVEVVYVSRSLDMEELQMEIRKWFANLLQIDHPPVYLTLQRSLLLYNISPFDTVLTVSGL